MYGTVSYVVCTGYGVDAIPSNTLLNLSTNSPLFSTSGVSIRSGVSSTRHYTSLGISIFSSGMAL